MGSREKLLQKILSKPPEVTFDEYSRFMLMNGWNKAREKGSHGPEGGMLTVPGKHGRTVSGTYITQALKVLELG